MGDHNKLETDIMAFIEKLNQLLIDKSHQKEFSGVILIQRDDNTLFKAVHGYANRSWKVENRLDTRFRIASLSKMFTAVAALQLIDAGKLSLDTSVIECLELENTRIPKEATVYHMLTMTSGIADWFDESGNWEEDWAELCRKHPIYLFRNNKDYLALFIGEEPVASVGEKHLYNGAGYILLGLIIERLSGSSYYEYIERQIFGKAQMLRSGFMALDDVDDEVAEGYIPITDESDKVIGWKKNIYSTTPNAAADGGATSTAADLVKFSQALRNGEFLSPALTQEMLAPKVLANDERFRGYTWKYGYGSFFILDQEDNIVRWGPTGEEDGVSCRLYYYPKENLDVIILGNQSWCAGSLGWQIHDLIIESSP
jgi:CubicO group peptidase (beta-lactamase class C family)